MVAMMTAWMEVLKIVLMVSGMAALTAAGMGDWMGALTVAWMGTMLIKPCCPSYTVFQLEVLPSVPPGG